MARCTDRLMNAHHQKAKAWAHGNCTKPTQKPQDENRMCQNTQLLDDNTECQTKPQPAMAKWSKEGNTACKPHQHPTTATGISRNNLRTDTDMRGSERSQTQVTRFHMDFSFLRGPKHLQSLLHKQQTPKHKIRNTKSHHPIKTSHDGCSSHLLITDAASRHAWTFLTKTKEPPLMTLNTFSSQNGLKKDQPKFTRTDQGGELAQSAAF